LLRIIGRLMSANSYYFETDDERKAFRKKCCLIGGSILTNYKWEDPYYTNYVLDIAFRILNSYALKDYESNYPTFIQSVI
jgi:hypothetical protein